VGPQSESFEELAMPLFDQLYNFAHWLTQNREEAEDLVQETYAKALKGFSSFQLGTNFRAWMYRILRNTFLTSRTGLRVTMMVPLDPEEDGPELVVEHDTPETLLLERSNRELLQSAIDELPVHFREVLLLCEVEEMSYSGTFGNAFGSYRHGHVAIIACEKNITRSTAATRASRNKNSGNGEGDDSWFVSPGRQNSTPISTASFRSRRCAPSTLMCADAPLARRMP